MLGGQVREQHVERADVEEERAGELDRRRPPGRIALRPVGAGVDELEGGGGREEERADEEDPRVRARPDQLEEAREGAEEEAERPDGEASGDPALRERCDSTPWRVHQCMADHTDRISGHPGNRLTRLR